jgi:molecular chaperone IbpA
MRAIDFAPLSRSTIGFEHLLNMLDTVADTGAADNYPPYNIEKVGEDKYRIALAVAGFAEDNLSVAVEANLLTVEGKRPTEESGTYLHHGIGSRAFRRQFNLADHIVVRGAKLENGLLVIELERELPEEMKPRRIEIDKGSGPTLVKSKQAA